MSDDTNPLARAIGALSELFFEKALAADDLASLERGAIEIGHECMTEALAIALESLDAKLLAERPESLRVHDVRRRMFATEIGDVSFDMQRYRDHFGCDV